MENGPRIDRENFRVRLDKLKRGITISWVVNFLLLTLTLEAAMIFMFMSTSSTNSEILTFVLGSLVIAAVIAAIAMAVLSSKSWKSIILEMGTIPVDDSTEKYLNNIVEEMSIAAGLTAKEIPIIGVIASPEPNAFALSGPDGSIIGVTTGLLEMTTREELQGIIAHEVGHLIAGDSKAMTKLIAMSSLVGIFSGIGMRLFAGRGGGDSKNPLALALIVLSLIFLIAAAPLSQLANASMQRKRESQADAISVRLTRNPTALATALRKIDAKYAELPKGERDSVDAKTKQLAFFSRTAYSTHPPTEERIHELKRMGADPTI